MNRLDGQKIATEALLTVKTNPEVRAVHAKFRENYNEVVEMVENLEAFSKYSEPNTAFFGMAVATCERNGLPLDEMIRLIKDLQDMKENRKQN